MAGLSFVCDQCHRTVVANAAMAGKRAQCPHCGETVAVPAFLPSLSAVGPKPNNSSRQFLIKLAVACGSVVLASIVLAVAVGHWRSADEARERAVAERATNAERERIVALIDERGNTPLPVSLDPADIKAFLLSAPPEHALAYLETQRRLPYNDPQVAAFDALLTLVDAKYKEDRASITSQAVLAFSTIRDTGHESSLAEILQGAASLHEIGAEAPPGGWSFREYASFYKVSRINQGLDHPKALASILGIERMVYAKAEGDQAKQAETLREAGIINEDDIGARVDKFLAFLDRMKREPQTKLPPMPPVARPEPSLPPPLSAKSGPLPAPPVDSPKAEKIYGYARQLEKSGRRTSALSAYRQILQDFPNTVQSEKAKVRLKAFGWRH